MHPIGDDTETCTPEKEFTEGDPTTSALATPLKAGWLNSIQRELLAILAAAAIDPSTEDDDQVLEALQLLFAALGHGHAIADVTGLQAALDARSLVGHLHAIANVTGLQAALDAKSDVGHLHDAIYAAALAVASGQLQLKSRSGATLSTVDLSPLPPGTVICHAASSPPTGFLECNGAAVSRTTYAALYAAIGTTWGAGDGSTTFNLPDLRGEFARGWDHGRGVDSGRAFGSAQASALGAHNHDNAVLDDYRTVHPHGTVTPAEEGRVPQYGVETHPLVKTGTTGGSETRPRNVAMLYVIKF